MHAVTFTFSLMLLLFTPTVKWLQEMFLFGFSFCILEAILMTAKSNNCSVQVLFLFNPQLTSHIITATYSEDSRNIYWLIPHTIYPQCGTLHSCKILSVQKKKQKAAYGRKRMTQWQEFMQDRLNLSWAAEGEELVPLMLLLNIEQLVTPVQNRDRPSSGQSVWILDLSTAASKKFRSQNMRKVGKWGLLWKENKKRETVVHSIAGFKSGTRI